MSAALATKQNGNGSAVAKPDDGKLMQYVPFGGETAIKLTAKIIQDMVCVPTRSGKRCSEVDAFRFMMLCQARRLNPFEGDCFMLGYDGKDGSPSTFSMITAHQAFLKRAESHPEFDGMESGVMVRDAEGNVIDREGDFAFDDDFILGGWAIVHFKTRKHPMKKRAKLATYSTGKSRWQADPCGMIVKVAEADALRSSFPTLMAGMYTHEEREHTMIPQAAAPAPTNIDAIIQQTKKPAPIEPPKNEPAIEPEIVEAPETTTSEDADLPPPDEYSEGLIERLNKAPSRAALATLGAEIKANEQYLAIYLPDVRAAYQQRFAAVK